MTRRTCRKIIFAKVLEMIVGRRGCGTCRQPLTPFVHKKQCFREGTESRHFLHSGFVPIMLTSGSSVAETSKNDSQYSKAYRMCGNIMWTSFPKTYYWGIASKCLYIGASRKLEECRSQMGTGTWGGERGREG